MTIPTGNSPFSLQGKRVLVVGGTRGLGRAIALQFAAAGARVIVNYVRESAAADELCGTAAAAGLPIEACRADMTSDKGREELAAFVNARFADLSTLVFSAATGVHRPLVDFTARHFDFTFNLNVKAFLLLVQQYLPRMVAGSTVIALSSEGAGRAVPQYGLVGASKGALESLCRNMAVELAPRGIRVNVLSPGTVETDVWKALPDAENRLRTAKERAPTKKLIQPQEVAWAAQFLASDASVGLIGHTLVVDGGARIVVSG
jgi:enoyl-[acyl-carrier protein] reductase III